MAEKVSSLGKAADALFRGIMYILYGKRAGETRAEKAARLGMVIIVLVALIVIFSMAKRAISPSRPKRRYSPRPTYQRPVERGARPSRPRAPGPGY